MLRQPHSITCTSAGNRLRAMCAGYDVRALVKTSVLLIPLMLVVGGCGPSARDDLVNAPSKVVEEKKPLPFPVPEVPPQPSQAYVGSHVCTECHSDVAEEYHSHPMSRSLAHVSEATPLEAYGSKNSFTTAETADADPLVSYYVEKTPEGEVVHHEVMSTRAGETIYDFAVPVDYEVGSGQRGRSYLVNHDGLLFMSPITWYSEQQRWDLSPGYDKNNLGFRRRIIDGCVACHAGRVAAIEDAPNHFEKEPFAEAAIGCERCHGPGEEHVAFRRNGGDNPRHDPIVNPAKLSAAERDHVCLQCHLSGENRLPRYGRSEFDFRPGDRLEEIWTIFLSGTGVDDEGATEAVSQAEQMMSSVCYLQSAGKMGCISCHDPHSIPQPEERIGFYRSRCLQCHGPSRTECSRPVERRLAVTPEDSCIVCHMPAIEANDVPHTSQTDHRILRDYRADDRSSPKPNREMHIMGASSGLIPDRELDRARAIYMVKTAEKTGHGTIALSSIPILEEWVQVVPDDFEAVENLGLAYFLTKDFTHAAKVWESGLKRNPNHEELLRRMLVLCHEAGQFKLGAEYGERLVKLNPWDYEYHGRLAHILARLDRFSEATESAEHALKLSPSAYPIHQWLAGIYSHLGDSERSRFHQQRYEALRPKAPPGQP